MTHSNAWVVPAQWLAILAMTGEHVTKFVWPESPAVPWAILVGRVAFPLFAGMVAWHLLHNTRRPMSYAGRLALVAFVAQLPYALLVVDPWTLNVCYTLAAGLLIAHLVQSFDARASRSLALVFTLLAAFIVGPSFEYGFFGLLLVPAFVLAFARPGHILSALPVLLLAALINGTPSTVLVSTATTAALVMLGNGSLRLRSQVPAIPRSLRLSWYPLHLAAIAIVVMAIRPEIG